MESGGVLPDSMVPEASTTRQYILLRRAPSQVPYGGEYDAIIGLTGPNCYSLTPNWWPLCFCYRCRKRTNKQKTCVFSVKVFFLWVHAWYFFACAARCPFISRCLLNMMANQSFFQQSLEHRALEIEPLDIYIYRRRILYI